MHWSRTLFPRWDDANFNNKIFCSAQSLHKRPGVSVYCINNGHHGQLVPAMRWCIPNRLNSNKIKESFVIYWQRMAQFRMCNLRSKPSVTILVNPKWLKVKRILRPCGWITNCKMGQDQWLKCLHIHRVLALMGSLSIAILLLKITTARFRLKFCGENSHDPIF